MSNYLTLIESHVFISAADKEPAFRALAGKVADRDGGVFGDLLWVDHDALEQSQTLEQQLEAFGWPCVTDADGNIVGLRFTGSKEGEETLLFRTLAPYFQSNSFIVAEGGSEGRRWRWQFHNGKVKKQSAAKPRVKPSDLGEYYRRSTNVLYSIKVETHSHALRNAADFESRLSNAVASSGCQPAGYLPRPNRLASISPGFMADYLERNETESKAAFMELVLSRAPSMELSVTWHDPQRIDDMIRLFASYSASDTTSAYAYASVRVWCGEGTRQDIATSLFENLVQFLEPFWAEFIDCTQTGRRYSFAGLNAHTHYVPHLASTNYFGEVYTKFFGGIERVIRAGCDNVRQVGKGCFVEIASAVNAETFVAHRDAVERALAELQAFGSEGSFSGNVPRFPCGAASATRRA